MSMPNASPNYAPGSAGFEAALGKVKPPGIALVVAGGLVIAGGLGNCVLGLLVGADETISDEQKGFLFLVYGFLAFVSIALGVITILGGVKMQSLRSYGLALAGSIVAMLPCNCGCLVGLPIGIWSLVVLLQQDVKAAFR